MKATIILLVLAICAMYAVQETEAIWYGGGGWGNYGGWFRRPYYGYRYGGYWPSYYYGGYRGWPYYWRRSVETKTSIECTYFEGRSVLSCVGPKGTTECETLKVIDTAITTPYKYYAIGVRYQGDLEKEPLKVHYSLYPQTDKKEYLNTTFIDTVTSKSYSYGLYHHPEYTFSGFRVSESECWKNLTGLLQEHEKHDFISVLDKPEHKEEVKILGGILLE